jgi:hypothetical protein
MWIPWQARTVRCLDCGFLYDGGLRYSDGAGSNVFVEKEILPKARSLVGEADWRPARCYRHAALERDFPDPSEQDFRPHYFDDESEAQQPRQRAIMALLSQERTCDWFTKYIPSYGPQEHLQKQDRDRDIRANVLTALGGGIVGGLLVLMGVLLERLAS